MTLDEIPEASSKKEEDDERCTIEESYNTTVELIVESIDVLKSAEQFIKTNCANNRATKKQLSNLSNQIIELEMFIESTE